MRVRFVEPSRPREGLREGFLKVRVVGCDPRGFAQMMDRLLGLAPVEQQLGQVAVGERVVRLDLDGPAVVLDRGLGIPLLREKTREVVVRHR